MNMDTYGNMYASDQLTTPNENKYKYSTIYGTRTN